MSKTLWSTIKIDVPKEMINITKKRESYNKKHMNKKKSQSNKELAINLEPKDINQPKIVSDGKNMI